VSASKEGEMSEELTGQRPSMAAQETDFEGEVLFLTRLSLRRELYWPMIP